MASPYSQSQTDSEIEMWGLSVQAETPETHPSLPERAVFGTPKCAVPPHFGSAQQPVQCTAMNHMYMEVPWGWWGGGDVT